MTGEGAAEDVFFPGLNAANLLFGEAEVDELEAVFAVGCERAGEAGGGALRGGGRVVEFVGQVAGEFTERGELFSLLLDAGYFAHAVEQRGDYALGHGRDGLKHLRKDGLGNDERPDRRDGEALPAVGLHAREGEYAGHLSCAADEQGHGATMLAADMNLAFEDKDHVLGRGAFFKEDIAGVGDELLAVASEPEAVFKGQAMERADAFEGLGDLFGRRGQDGRGDGGGEHPGTSGCSLKDS